jgi:chromosome segregation protein
MRLSGIKLAGFKSFVDPTHLPLPANLTSVVGPNGCGKSNIIDAVRWVLGETSMKNLRGADAEDVIFNGSKSRKPVGRASVELLFDNSDGQVTGAYAAYSEISVRRELTRDGSSQYFLNGRKCLKRDVTDLFLGTGLGGKNQYAIIEQGMVSRMIEAKPEELRHWLEEAAGISKYKDRRRETESRIRQTRENLDRLNDVRTELQGRLEVLQRQAANAEKYKQLKADERRLKAELLLLRTRQLEAEQASQQAAIEAREASAQQSRAALEAAQQQRADAEARLRASQEAIHEAQTRLYECEASQAQAQQTLAHTRELQQLQQREREGVERGLGELGERITREQQRLDQAREQLVQLDEAFARAEAEEQSAQSALIEAEDALAQAQKAWDLFTHDAEAPLTQTEAERVRVQALERSRFQAQERLKRIEQELASLNVEAVQQSLQEAETELADLQVQVTEHQQRLTEVDQQLSQVRETRRADEATLHDARQQQQSVKGRLSSLETLQQAAMRRDDAELNQWLQQQQLQQAPRLAQVLDVTPGWEAAVEQVLEGLLQAPVLDRLDQRSWPAQGPKAGLTVMDGALRRGERGLAQHVRGPGAVLAVLAEIEPVSSPEDLAARRGALAPGASCITPQGLWGGRDWLRYPRGGDDNKGVIVRGRLIQELRDELERVETRIARLDGTVREQVEQMQRLEAERRSLAAQFEQSRSRHAQKLAVQQSQQVRLEQMQARQARLLAEQEEAAGAMQSSEQELGSARARLTDLETVAAALKQQRGEVQQTLAKRRDDVQRARAHLAGQQSNRNQQQVQRASRQSALSGMEQGLNELVQRHQAMAAQVQSNADKAEQWAQPLAEQEAALTQAQQTAGAAREQLRQVRQQAEGVEQGLVQAQQALMTAEQQREAAGEAVQVARLAAENSRARGEALVGQLAETGFERSALEASVAADAEPAAWEGELSAVLRRVERLGAINLAAIQELEEGQARAEYLDTQHADLVGALETLEAAMQKIDTETKALFRDTFDRVNTVFVDRFPKLFGGGEAYLELTGDDLLDTGVRVMARPPGKRNSTIQLLSGGEKAMTAVALLLALFQLNPAPFCLMDEVDAPLDDANVGRFCDVVREMSEAVQFIIITHNKITMELAAHLHGVTMQEPGVSRLVSVDVQQAVALTEDREAVA